MRYCFDDHLGSSAYEVDAQAQVISQEVYYPFGGTAWLAGRHEVETGYKTIRYSGKERDATGLYYYGARYYAPWLQRWLNPDPAGDVDGVNFYRFVRNSPDNYVDGQGNFPTPASIFRAWYELIEYAVDWFDGTYTSSGVELEHEGMDEFRRNDPDLAADLDHALNLAEKNLQHAVAVLERGQLDLHIAGANFGEMSLQDVNYLSRGYRGMILDIESIRNNQERLVFVSGGKADAFVRKIDAARGIYINVDNFFKNSIEIQSHILGHELTHLSADFQSEDFWYLSKAQFDSWDEVLGWSRVIMREGVENGFLNPEAESDFISRAGMRNVIEAREKFYNSSAFRTRLALHNADTLMNFAELVNNSR